MTMRLASDAETEQGRMAREKFRAEQAAAELGRAAAALTSNLMRIVAGAGSPHTVAEQALELLGAWKTLREFSGSPAFPFAPEAPIAVKLREFDWRKDDPRYSVPTKEDLDRWEADGYSARYGALEEIATHALRWRASQLMAQPTHESTAEHALKDAVIKLQQTPRRPDPFTKF